MSAAEANTIIDDERIRVTTWTFGAKGEATGWHVHEFDYLIVPVTGGRFSVTDPDGGTHELAQQAGTPYVGTAGTEHDVTYVGATPASFVEIELKG